MTRAENESLELVKLHYKLDTYSQLRGSYERVNLRTAV